MQSNRTSFKKNICSQSTCDVLRKQLRFVKLTKKSDQEKKEKMAKVNFSMFPIHRIFPDNYPSACYQLLNLSSAFTAALLRPSRPKPAARSGYKTAGCIKVIHVKCSKKSNESGSYLFVSGHIEPFVAEISAILLKYPISMGVFFMFSWAKNVPN